MENKERLITLTIEQAKEVYAKNPEYRNTFLAGFTNFELGIFPHFATELEQIKRPYYITSSGDIVDPIVPTRFRVSNFKTRKRAEEVLALIQVLAFRDDVWEKDGNWFPEAGPTAKYGITINKNHLVPIVHYTYNQILSFRTREIRDWFLETHKELIEKCKYLI